MIILTIIGFLILSAFFSGSEIAFISANKLGIEVKRNKDSKRGKIIAGFYEKPSNFLGAMLIGNNISLVIFTYCMTRVLEPLFSHLMNEGPWMLLCNTIVSTVVVLIFGEFLPKTFFKLFSNEVLFLFAYPLKFLFHLHRDFQPLPETRGDPVLLLYANNQLLFDYPEAPLPL